MVSGHLTAKRNRWYAVLNLKYPDGRRYSKWISTGLTIAGNKRKADERLQELRRQYSLGGDIHSSGILFTGYMSAGLKPYGLLLLRLHIIHIKNSPMKYVRTLNH